MPNYTKKTAKLQAEVLASDEQLLGATYVLPAGRFGRTVGFQSAGVIGAAAAEYAAKKRRDEHGDAVEGGLAETLPEHQDVVLAITDRRFLVFSFGRVKGVPKDLVVDFPIDDVAAIEASPGKLMTRITIVFSDGSVADYDAQKMAKPAELTDGFARATGRA